MIISSIVLFFKRETWGTGPLVDAPADPAGCVVLEVVGAPDGAAVPVVGG